MSAWRKEAGLELEDGKTASRGHRTHLERVRRFGDGRQAAHSATHGEFWEAAGRGGNLKIGSGLAARRTDYHSVILRDPYLTQILFADFPEVQEKNGSSGRTQTYNPPVNSRTKVLTPYQAVL